MKRRALDVAIIGMSCDFPGSKDLCAFFEQIVYGKKASEDSSEYSLGNAIQTALSDAGLPRGIPDSLSANLVVATDGEGRGAHGIDFVSNIDSPLLGQFATKTLIETDASTILALKSAMIELASKRTDLAVVAKLRLSHEDSARTNGVAVLVLKRLADAVVADDRVYAVIKSLGIARLRSSAISSQRTAMRRAYHRAGFDPATVEFVESVGMDSTQPDRTEIRSLRSFYPASKDQVLGLSSNSAAIPASSSDLTSIIKTALCLYHAVVPASGDVVLSRRERASFSVRSSVKPWIHGDPSVQRRAAVNIASSSEIAGHLILERHDDTYGVDKSRCLVSWDTEAIFLSAADRSSLISRASNLIDWLGTEPNAALKDLAFTLSSVVVEPGFCRLGIVAASLSDLASRLKVAVQQLSNAKCHTIHDSRGIYFWQSPVAATGSIAMLFPGEGSQYPGMLSDLCLHFPEILRQFDIAERIGREHGTEMRPSRALFGEQPEANSKLWSMGPAINAVLSSQWALFQLLMKLGVRPDVVCGHSSGEFLALAAAGAVQVDRRFEDGLAGLGALFETMETSGNVPPAILVAVGAGLEKIQTVVRDLPGVLVAMDNCPHQVVLAGSGESIDELTKNFRAAGIMADVLPFERAYHTPAFSAVVEPIRGFFERLDLTTPTLPIYSCASADTMPSDASAVLDLAVLQWTSPVRFRETVKVMHDDGARVFIDVGARGNLAGFVEDTLRGSPSLTIAANIPRRSGLTQLNHLVAMLFAQGIALKTNHLYSRRRPALIDFDKPTAKPEVVAEVPPRFQQRAHISEPSLAAFGVYGNPFEMLFEGDLTEHSRHFDAYSKTMTVFAATQNEVMRAFFGRNSSVSVESQVGLTFPLESNLRQQKPSPSRRPGPLAGEIIQRVGNSRVLTHYRLEIANDPVARNHTLGGRRVSSIDPERLGLPVLPFAIMAEMLAEVASIIAPELTMVALEDVRAHKWIRYEDSPILLEIEATTDLDQSGRVRAAIYNRGPIGGLKTAEQPVVEGTVVFQIFPESPPIAPPFALENPCPSVFKAERIYADQWLFHGPVFQAVVHVGQTADMGIEGTLQVLPTGRLLSDPGRAAELKTDPICLDAFTHLLGCWGLDRLKTGDVIFPLKMGRLAIFGVSPAVGAEVNCRIHVRNVDPFRVRVDADLVRQDGTTWMQIRDWEDWRFHWPGQYRDVFRRPEIELVGETLSLGPRADPSTTVAIWLKPPADMGRPVWRDVLEQTQLSPREHCVLTKDVEPRRSQRLWGRMAAKEAGRRLWLSRESNPIFPADLDIQPDANGRPILRHLDSDFTMVVPQISIAHTQGVAVAIATWDSHSHVGIDVEPIASRTKEFESIAFSPAEQAVLNTATNFDRDEAIARLWCAKEAAGKASRLGLIAGPSSVDVLSLGFNGIAVVQLGEKLRDALPELEDKPMLVFTERKDDYVWAWTLGEGSDHDA